MAVACPNCGSRYLRDSQTKSAGERVRWWLFEQALRCNDCKHRFVASTLALGDIRYAKCPICKRMDLNAWSGKTYTPEGLTAFKVNLGAKKWRCEYCRINFAAFRDRKEVFSFKRWQRMNVGNAVRDGRARHAELEFRANKAREEAQLRAREHASSTRLDEDSEDTNYDDN